MSRQTVLHVFDTAFKDKNYFQEIGKNFEYGSTSQSQHIKDIDRNVKYLYSMKHFGRKVLGMFGQIKKEVEKNIKEKGLQVPERQNSLYYKFKKFEELEDGEFEEYSNVYELDINKAYYVALKNLGYISEEFYNKCLDQPKRVRLALVGSLATMKVIQNYENGVSVSEVPEIRTNDLTRNVFFHVVKYVDDILYSFSLNREKHFLFYWVDGIFFEDYGEKNILEDLFYFKKYKDVEFSIKKWEKFQFFKDPNRGVLVKMKKNEQRWKCYNISN